MKIILAHGALGPFDEMMYAVPEVIFVLTMVYSWLRSRKARFDPEDKAAGPTETEKHNS